MLVQHIWKHIDLFLSNMGASGKAKESHHAPPNSAQKAEAEAYAASPEGKAEAARAAKLQAEEKRREALLNAQTQGLLRFQDQDDVNCAKRKATLAAEETDKKLAAANLRLAAALAAGRPTERLQAAANRAAAKAAVAAAKAAAAEVGEPVVVGVAADDVSDADFE